MDHHDHVALLRPAALRPGGRWADLGAGSGAFTLALRELVGADAVIFAIDREQAGLRELERTWRKRFEETSNLHLLHADFTETLNLPALDGVMMANSLHFFRDKESVMRHAGTFLKPGGVLLLVEYNVDAGNLWVPFPLSFKTYQALAVRAGFSAVRLLGTHPSNFLRGFYSAEAVLENPDKDAPLRTPRSTK
jgi:ubiquinone/menaquinone biosynthesis C-methylase UbiE